MVEVHHQTKLLVVFDVGNPNLGSGHTDPQTRKPPESPHKQPVMFFVGHSDTKDGDIRTHENGNCGLLGLLTIFPKAAPRKTNWLFSSHVFADEY